MGKGKMSGEGLAVGGLSEGRSGVGQRSLGPLCHTSIPFGHTSQTVSSQESSPQGRLINSPPITLWGSLSTPACREGNRLRNDGTVQEETEPEAGADLDTPGTGGLTGDRRARAPASLTLGRHRACGQETPASGFLRICI